MVSRAVRPLAPPPLRENVPFRLTLASCSKTSMRDSYERPGRRPISSRQNTRGLALLVPDLPHRLVLDDDDTSIVRLVRYDRPRDSRLDGPQVLD